MAHPLLKAKDAWVADAAEHLDRAISGYALTKDQEIACGTVSALLALVAALGDAAAVLEKALKAKGVI